MGTPLTDRLNETLPELLKLFFQQPSLRQETWQTLVRLGIGDGIFQLRLHLPICLLVKGFFKGTSAEQDRRFSDKELKLLKSMKFPPEFDKKV